MTHSDIVLVIDFGSQLTRLIARRVREVGVYSEIVSYKKAWEAFLVVHPKCVILSGGPCSVTKADSPRLSQNFLSAGIPILGICYGAQVLCQQLGGEVENTHYMREFGRTDLKIEQDSPLFSDIWEKDETYKVWMSHGDRVISLPDGFQVIASSSGTPFAALANEKQRFYAVQFHPEVVNTTGGDLIIRNFVRKIAKISGEWTLSSYKEKAILGIRKKIGKNKVLCGLSGGVDSTVTAILLHKAIGEQLTCILIDHGLMRKNEAMDIIHLFQEKWSSIPLIHVNAEDIFLKALATVSDPEQKRKIIGKLFVEIFEKEAEKIGKTDFLAQGTLYPDIIESISFAGDHSIAIKSHHNVGGLPKRMKLQLVEPLRELFKDEVRILGQELGLPSRFISRHPFPGPGLAIRCPGCVDRKKLDLLREADALYLEEIHKAGLYNAIWQAFAVLLPVQAVGIMGDARTYEYVCALRAVTSVDGMTADFYPYDIAFLGRVATRIINEVPGINRVVYDLTSKPPGTIEWE